MDTVNLTEEIILSCFLPPFIGQEIKPKENMWPSYCLMVMTLAVKLGFFVFF